MIFKPEDFKEYCIKNPGAPHDICIAEIANAKFKEWIENSISTSGTLLKDGRFIVDSFPTTHEAKIVMIEPIKDNNSSEDVMPGYDDREIQKRDRAIEILIEVVKSIVDDWPVNRPDPEEALAKVERILE